MLSLSRTAGNAFSLLCLLLLFLPKVNLITFGGRETAGIRIDDMLLFSVALLIFWAHLSTGRRLLAIERLMFVIVAFSIASYLINRFFVAIGELHVDANILYAFRIFEYFIFFYAGLYAAKEFSIDKVVLGLLLLNFLLMIAQKAGLVGYFSNYGYSATNSYRCSGIASFPSEMGLVLNILFSFLLAKSEEYGAAFSKFMGKSASLTPLFSLAYPLFLLLLFTFLIAINGSRIALAAMGFVFFLYVIRHFSAKTFAAVAAIATAAGALLLTGSGIELSIITERAENLLKWENVDLIKEVWEAVDTDVDPIGNEAVRYDDATQDESWWMRIHKWTYALKIYWDHPKSYLQGIGPGFATAGLDGGILRIAVEYGIIGILLFFALFKRIASSSELLFLATAALLVNMIFFDAYLAYKPMSLYFLLAGWALSAELYSERQENREGSEVSEDL